VRLKGSHRCEAMAWAANGRVQIQLGMIRFTATVDEAASFARQLIDAVEKLRADQSSAAITRES
jgi:hypothetical protein